MPDSIYESLNKIREIESKEILNENTAVAAPVAQAASKGIGRYIIPGVGAALGAQDAYNRYKKGDLTGAAISGVGAAASLIPGVGGLVGGLGSAGLNALRDKQRTGSYLPSDDEIAAGVAKDKAAQPTATAAAPVAAPVASTVPPGGDPKVFALQKQLIAKGAKIKADGIMGDQTRTAMKQFPGVAVAEQNKGNDMSESQRIAELMSRLAQLEQSQPQVADEGIADLAKGVGNFFRGAKAGAQGGAAASNVASGAANLGKAGDKGMAAAQAVKNAGQTVKTAATSNTAKNIAKVGGGAAAGAGTVAALSGGAATKPADAPNQSDAETARLARQNAGAAPKPTAGAGTKPAAAPAAAPAGPSPADLQELGTLAQELEPFMGQLPDLDNALLAWEKVKASIPQPE
jgi:hypothetical protein